MIAEGKCPEAIAQIHRKLQLHVAQPEEGKEESSIEEYKVLKATSSDKTIGVAKLLIKKHSVREILEFIREDFDPVLLFWLIDDFAQDGDYHTFY